MAYHHVHNETGMAWCCVEVEVLRKNVYTETHLRRRSGSERHMFLYEIISVIANFCFREFVDHVPSPYLTSQDIHVLVRKPINAEQDDEESYAQAVENAKYVPIGEGKVTSRVPPSVKSVPLGTIDITGKLLFES